MYAERPARDTLPSLPHPPAFPFGWFKEPPFGFNFTRHSQFQRNFDNEPRCPTAISPLQVGPPTRRELAPGHAPSPSIEKLYALLPRSCADLSIHFRVAKPTLNSITRVPTSSLPTSAPHTVSTEHDRDSQRVVSNSIQFRCRWPQTFHKVASSDSHWHFSTCGSSSSSW